MQAYCPLPTASESGPRGSILWISCEFRRLSCPSLAGGVSCPCRLGPEVLTENRSRCEHCRTMPRPRSDSPALFELEDIRPDFRIERRAMKRGQWPVAGLDEAGRGPLAGPVVAAAVILDPKRIPTGLDDSKRLTAEERETLFEALLKEA